MSLAGKVVAWVVALALTFTTLLFAIRGFQTFEIAQHSWPAVAKHGISDFVGIAGGLAAFFTLVIRKFNGKASGQ